MSPAGAWIGIAAGAAAIVIGATAIATGAARADAAAPTPAPANPATAAAAPTAAPAPARPATAAAAKPAAPAVESVSGESGGVRFVNVAAAAGLHLANACGSPDKATINETVGNGVCMADVDGDGWLDLYVPNGIAAPGDRAQPAPRSALYRRRGDLAYEEIGVAAGVALPGHWSQGCVFADYDDDGRPDLFVTGFGRYYLFRNKGGLRFEDVTAAAGLAGGRGWSTGAAFGDYDRDGRIDLYVSHYVDYDQDSPPLPKAGSDVNCFYRGFPVMCGPRGLKPQMGRLFRNEGARFRDVSAAAGMLQGGVLYGLGAVWSDLDEDGDADLYVATDSTPNLLYRNDGGGKFTEIGTLSGAAFSEEGRTQASMGVAAGDLDGDGLDELMVTNFSHDYTTLYHNEGGLNFSDVSLMSGIGAPTMPTLGWGDAFLDYDNDGLRDVFMANGHVYPGIDALNIGTTWKQVNQLFRNLGGLRFREVTAQAGPGFAEKHSARGSAVGDLDNDGDPDIVINNMDEPPSLLRNDGGNRRHWIGFRLAGAPRNRGAIGARVAILEGTRRRQVLEVQAGASHNSGNDPRLLFGLGDARGPVRVEVRWPSGKKSIVADLAVDRYHDLSEPSR